jgi:DNA polymerase III sliding clamp (beta) subunit (PCNA family)
MKVNKVELQQALEIVKPGLANKELIEQSTSFAFMAGRVVTYNDEISISHPIKGLDLEGAIKADKLYLLLSKIKKEEIEMTVEDNEILITSGRSHAGLTLQSEIKLPLDEEEVSQHGKWKVLPAMFLKLMTFAVSSCTRSNSDPILKCVHVNQEGFVEASDNQRITHCELGEPMPVETFLISADSVIAILRLKPTKIAEGKGWIHFKTDLGTIISSRILEDEFPSTAKMLNVKGTRLILPKVLASTLEKAGVFAKRDHLLDEKVEITLMQDKLRIFAEADTGWFKETIPLKYSGETITFCITPYLLKNILNETSACELSSNKLKFEGEGWMYVARLRND